MDDAKRPIFVALIMVVAAEIVIGKSDIVFGKRPHHLKSRLLL